MTALMCKATDYVVARESFLYFDLFFVRRGTTFNVENNTLGIEENVDKQNALFYLLMFLLDARRAGVRSYAVTDVR